MLLQVTLTFVIYDWDGPLIGDDLLGVAKLSLSQVCMCTCTCTIRSLPAVCLKFSPRGECKLAIMDFPRMKK